MRGRLATLLCIGALLATGCGGGSSSGDPGGNDSTITSGNWAITATSTVVGGQLAYLGGNLTQSGRSLSGVLHVIDSDCFNIETNVPVSGTVSGQTFRITSASIDGQVVTVDGTIVTSGSVSGTYSITGGCAAGDRGTITGVQIPHISGTWKATEASGSTTITTTANITQQPTATTDGIFPISGTVTFTNSPCSTSGTIDSAQSFMVGDVLGVVINTNDIGGGTGQMLYVGFLENPSAPTKFMGMYEVMSGNCTGLSNTLDFTKQ